MSQLRQFGVSIDGLLSIATKFRDAIAWGSRYGLTRDDAFALWSVFNDHEFHRSGQMDDDELAASLAAWSNERHGTKRVTPRIQALHGAMTRAEFRQHLEPFITITELPRNDSRRAATHPDVTYFWRVDDQWKFERGESAPEQARNDGALATIAVDVSTVIYDVWNRQ